MQRIIDTIKKRRDIQCFILIFFAELLCVIYSDFRIIAINSTTLSLSYEYGLLPRGLLGAIFHAVCYFFPNAYSINGSVAFCLVMTVILYSLVLILISNCITKASDNSYYLFLIAIFLLWYLCPMYVASSNFGRADILCMIFTIGACLTIINDKYLFLCIPLSALAVMAHDGFVFMFSGIILALLLYKVIKSDSLRRKYYAVIFASTLIIISILFIWFSFIFSGVSSEFYDIASNDAAMLSPSGDVFESILKISILSQSVQNQDSVWLPIVFAQFPIFIVLMAPYVYLLIRFFINLIKDANTVKDKLAYIVLALGFATIVPELLLMLDYGRWSFCIIFYYCVVLLITGSLDLNIMDKIKQYLIPKSPVIIGLLLVYPVIFQPLLDVSICSLTRLIFSHLYTIFVLNPTLYIC